MRSTYFRDPHGYVQWVRESGSERGRITLLSLVIPEGAGRWRAIRLPSITPPFAENKVIEDFTRFDAMRELAKSCPLYADTNPPATPSLEGLANGIASANRLMLTTSGARPADRVDPAALRKSLEALHRDLTNYLVSTASRK